MPSLDYYRMLLDEFGPSVKAFDREVYTRGLARIAEAGPSRGMSGELAGVIMLTYVFAGRVAVTLTRGVTQVTMAAAEGETPSRLGLHTTQGNVRDGRALIEAVIAAWPEGEAEQAAILHANPDLRFA
jgi:hypothetical protein